MYINDLDDLHKYQYGNEVDLTVYSSSNKFIAPSDGYIRMFAANTLEHNYAIANVNGFLDEIYTNNTDYNQGNVVFVKAGMALFGSATEGSSSRYYPLV